MKDLGLAQMILSMVIVRKRDKHKMKIHQTSYFRKLLSKFGMEDSKPAKIPLAGHFLLSNQMCLKIQEEKKYMVKVPYCNVVGLFMYSMVSTRPDLSHAMSVLS